MTQATVGFLDANGNWVPVTATTGLPTSGGGGGGGAVDSVNGKQGSVTLDAADVGAPALVSSPNRLYGTDGSGAQSSHAVSEFVATSAVAGLDTVGWGRAVYIANGGTVPVGTPPYTIVIEASA